MGDQSLDEKVIFNVASSIESVLARAEYLNHVCGNEPELLQRVSRLLKIHAESPSFLEAPAEGIAASIQLPAPGECLGASIGPYKLRELLGEGGMGSVYVAEQEKPVRRKVALKIIKPGMDSQEVIYRFEAERQALAMMDHPNIAKVLDAGTTESGTPYFVMEIVKGTPITEHCDSLQLNTRERLQLFLQVCQAVQHAHLKGIVHRDLKPSNVIVELHDTTPVVKMIDFGVAKAIDRQLTEHTAYTGISQIIGTPLYMSPEQAGQSSLDIDARSDIYSLGVLLYELLTGTTPFENAAFRSAGFDEMRRIIREVDPPRPSARVSTLEAAALSTIAECRQIEPRKLSQLLCDELDCIVMKSLEKERTRRYGSASSLAADIQRFLADEPVLAQRASVLYRSRKWMHRHFTLTIVAVVSFLALAALSVGGSFYNHRLTRLLDDSQQIEAESLSQKRILRLETYSDDMHNAWIAWKAGDTRKGLEDLMRHQPQLGEQDDVRGFEWHLLYAHYQPAMRTLRGHMAPILTAHVSENDRLIASGDSEGTVKIWDLATGRELQSLQYSSQEVTCVRFAPNGQTLATCGMDRTIRLWNTADWTEQACLRGHEATVCSIAWSPDSQEVASGGRDQSVKIWDVVNYREVKTLSDQADVVRCVAWSPDGKLLAAAVRDGGIPIWNTKTWGLTNTLQGHGRNSILALAFAADSQRLASGGYCGHSPILINHVSQQVPLAEYDVSEHCWSLCFSDDGDCLVAGRGDGQVQAWETGKSEGPLVELGLSPVAGGLHDVEVRAVAFAHSGRSIVVALEQDQVLQAHSTAALVGSITYRIAPPCLDIAPNFNRTMLRFPGGRLQLSSIPPRESCGQLLPHPRPIRDAKFFPQGDMFATVGDEPCVRVYDSLNLERRHALETRGNDIRSLTISLNGKYIAGSDTTGAVWLWDVENQSVIQTLREHKKPTVRSAFAPDGKTIATASSNEQQILLWNVINGDKIASLQVSQDVAYLTFSPDGTTLAIAGFDGAALLWDVSSCNPVAVLHGHTGPLRGLDFSPDGGTLATVGDDGTARLWHVATRQELVQLTDRSRPLQWVKFLSPLQLVVGTREYFSDPDRVNEVIIFDAGEQTGVSQ